MWARTQEATIRRRHVLRDDRNFFPSYILAPVGLNVGSLN